ncbi:MAG: tRNA (adenosine(37)-N6)-threonylcarbamoyltransferase complex dimerization subunit type 1 TsaB [Zhengella sp.]|uniref:tRNA (adenosine(37)-N6)-threonylcarbamoyltransferase complex dimerization subunit type 1 TsaB n=1 Tax=Zhengella sp. TaxID=2282762 RepID=UPI003529CB43|nr:tRNA (adenosine(37)-N6)-threonylcarbamoyltransferase complex dimerization subunit type 1 TsaB [Brucellaceae bacterium]
MTLLAIDTAANLCAACLSDAETGAILGAEVLDIGKGHAEQLMDVIAQAMAEAGAQWPDLTRLAVTVGPGSFTGIRVGVAAARGLALALDLPLTGITTLEALAAETRAAQPDRPVLAALDARRGEIYAQVFGTSGEAEGPPVAMKVADAAARVRSGMALCGSAAAMVAEMSGEAGLAFGPRAAAPDIAVVAALAAARPPTQEKPKPLYLRAADARPQEGFALPRRPA